MSPDEDALLNGIAATPADDLPRLVYADWLEDHGQDIRAEFIRIQCEIARLEVGPRAIIDRNVHLWRRQQELLDGYAEAISHGVGFPPRYDGRVHVTRYYRGFVDEVSLDDAMLAAEGEGLAALRPTPSQVSVTAEVDREDTVTALPPSAPPLVTSLQYIRSERWDDSLRAARQPPLSGGWPRLHTLIAANRALRFATVLESARLHMPALRQLTLFSYAVADSDVIDLLNAGVLQRLSHISLIENAIGDQAAIELADRLGNSPNLKELDLRRNGITRPGQEALLARLGSKVILF